MRLYLLLLRPQDQEVHDHEDQRERQQLEHHAVATAAAAEQPCANAGVINIRSVLVSIRGEPAAPLGPTAGKFARTIAASPPIATLPEPRKPAILSTFRPARLAGAGPPIRLPVESTAYVQIENETCAQIHWPKRKPARPTSCLTASPPRSSGSRRTAPRRPRFRRRPTPTSGIRTGAARAGRASAASTWGCSRVSTGCATS